MSINMMSRGLLKERKEKKKREKDMVPHSLKKEKAILLILPTILGKISSMKNWADR